MSIFSSLLKGAVGFLTGNWAGAAAGIASDLLGGGSSAPGPSGTVAPVTMAKSTLDDNQAINFMRAFIAQAERNAQKPATVFSAQDAMQPAMPTNAPRSQTMNNQIGGMSYPQGANSWFYNEPKGPGRGGATLGADDDYQQRLNAILKANQQYAGPQATAFQSYMSKALAGLGGLPQQSYDRAYQQGANIINAQTQNARQNLMANLGSRGLMRSGLTGAGLMGVEQSRLGALGNLGTGLAQQGLQAAREAQAQAVSVYPQLVAADQQGLNTRLQGFIALQQLELQARQLGISQAQIDEYKRSGNLAMLGQLIGSYVMYRNQPAAPAPSGSAWPGNVYENPVY